MKPFFNFYGGKWRAAKKYPAPKHEIIVEPFAGSAGYSLRHHEKQVILVEADQKIAGIWCYLIGATHYDILRLPIHVEDVLELDVCQEAQWLIGMWVNKGVHAPCRKPSAWMRSGKYRNCFWGEHIRKRIADQVENINHWELIVDDYSMAPRVAATWFVDPPYQGPAGRKYTSQPESYSDLGVWVRCLPGQVIVCEQEGADWLPFETFGRSRSNHSRTGTRYSNEVIWTKG